MRSSRWTPLSVAAFVSGAAGYVLSFLDAYLLIPSDGPPVGISAWFAGAAWGMLLFLYTVAQLGVEILAPQLLPGAVRRPAVVPILAALSTLLTILPALLNGGKAGVGWSAWAMWIALIVFTGCATARAVERARAVRSDPGRAEAQR